MASIRDGGGDEPRAGSISRAQHPEKDILVGKVDLEGGVQGEPDYTIDVARGIFPYCIVWTHLGPCSWCAPPIGHMGIGDSSGKIHDFVGGVSHDNFMLGPPLRYIQLNPKRCKRMSWDEGVSKGNRVYEDRCHNICCDNCHSHVGKCLESMRYAGVPHWNMFMLGAWVFFAGKFTSLQSALCTVVPCTIIGVLLWLSYG
jgi:hypothetical protein